MNPPIEIVPPLAPVVLDKCTRFGMTIFKRYPGPDQAYYCKFKYRGKQKMVKLLASADESFKKARQVRAELRAGRFDLFDQILAAAKERRPHSPLGDIFTRYETGAAAAIDIVQSTVTHNIHSIRNIFRRAISADLTDDVINKMPSTDFNPALLEKYKSAMLRLAGTDKIAEDRTKVTANSTIRHARCLFAKKLPDKFYDGLILPPVAELKAVKLFKENRAGFSMPAPDLLKRIADALPQLKKSDPNAYIIYLLSFKAGPRPGEIKHGRQSWFEEHTETKDGKPVTQILMRVQTQHDFRSKGKRERLIPIDAATHAELKELMIPTLPGQPDYIMRGSKTERTDQAFRRFAHWLTNLGWTRLKKAHEFRKIFGSHVVHQAGMRAGQLMLGHKHHSTTERYYVGQIDIPEYKIPALG